ncbi:MAG: hypothetical protein ACK53Y_06550, partial [bacterium]
LRHSRRIETSRPQTRTPLGEVRQRWSHCPPVEALPTRRASAHGQWSLQRRRATGERRNRCWRCTP